MIWDELWPSSEESRFPGRPADSQLEHISTASQIAQWNRAPTMSSMQLKRRKLRFWRRYRNKHLLSTFNTGVCHSYHLYTKYICWREKNTLTLLFASIQSHSVSRVRCTVGPWRLIRDYKESVRGMNVMHLSNDSSVFWYETWLNPHTRNMLYKDWTFDMRHTCNACWQWRYCM